MSRLHNVLVIVRRDCFVYSNLIGHTLYPIGIGDRYLVFDLKF